jgi:hypothetical protein
LIDIGTRLQDDGRFVANEIAIAPPEECSFKFRYELLPRGELSLKLELMWWEDEADEPEDEAQGDLTIS